MKLSKTQLIRYVGWLKYEHPMCQICHRRPTADAHHTLYGYFGNAKDDTSLIAVCRKCHKWSHQNKHESQEKYLETAKNNWKEYNDRG